MKSDLCGTRWGSRVGLFVKLIIYLHKKLGVNILTAVYGPLQKINQGNTWDLGLIDHLSDLVKNDINDDEETNFQLV